MARSLAIPDEYAMVNFHQVVSFEVLSFFYKRNICCRSWSSDAFILERFIILYIRLNTVKIPLHRNRLYYRAVAVEEVYL